MPAIAEFRSEPSGGVIFSKNGAFTQPFNMGLVQKKQSTYEDFFWGWLDNQSTPDRLIGYFWLFNVGNAIMTGIKIRPTEQLLTDLTVVQSSTPSNPFRVAGIIQLHQYSLKVAGISGSGISEQTNTAYQKNTVEIASIVTTESAQFFCSTTSVHPKYQASPTLLNKYDIPTGTHVVGYTVTYFQVDDIPPGCGRKISVQFHPLCVTSLESYNHGLTVEFN